jgi:polyisoprenoid-binding protein YceI
VVDGEIHVADPLDASSATAQLAASSFTSGIGTRDLQVKSRMFLHARKHPFLTPTTSTRLAHIHPPAANVPPHPR